MVDLSKSDETLVNKMYLEGVTIREMAEITGIDKESILFYLTKKNKWSPHCSTCRVRECYDCPGLEKWGRMDLQDMIDYVAYTKDAKNGPI